MQAPPGLYCTSVQTNVLKTILTNKLKYKMKKKRESRYREFIFRQISRFILGQPSNILDMGYSRGSKYGHGRGRSYGGGASRGFNRGSPTPKPVEAGKEYEVDITEISRQGDGVARIQGFVVFVQNGKVGNNIKVKVTEVGDRSAKATISA